MVAFTDVVSGVGPGQSRVGFLAKKKNGMMARGGQHWRRVGRSERHGKVIGGKGNADRGQGAVICEGRAKTEGNVETGHWAKGGTQGMMKSREQGKCWD